MGITNFAEAVANWDPSFATDGFSRALDWIREESRKQQSDAVENRAERFRAWAATYGQGQVDAWKGVHEDPDVQEGYNPHIPQWEIDAVETTYEMILERQAEIDEEAHLYVPHAARYVEQATESYEACVEASGQRGRENLENFWMHADRIADCARGVGL